MPNFDNSFTLGMSHWLCKHKTSLLYCTHLYFINEIELHMQNARSPPLLAVQILNMLIARNEKDSSQAQYVCGHD